MSQPTTPIRTIIIPAAGKGTRMLPATQVTAKELLPVYDRPVIQFAIDEAIEAGAARIIVVISATKPAIRELLGDKAFSSTEGGTEREYSAETAPEIVYVTQDEPMGLGHAILCCKGLSLPGPLGIILPDDIIIGRGCLAEMAGSYREGNMIAAMKVPIQETCRYGIFSLRGAADGNCFPVTGMIEKPPRGTAPSSIAAVGRYILHQMIFDVLEHTPKGAGGELQLTDAIDIATQSVPLTAFRFSGTRYDCGSHDGLLAASNARQAAVKSSRTNAPLFFARPSASSESNGIAHGPDHARLPVKPARHMDRDGCPPIAWRRKVEVALLSNPPVETTERVLNVLVTAMTQKEKPMDWVQIETKWAAMAHRIRANVHCGKTDDGVVLQRRTVKDEAAKSVVAKQIAAVGSEIRHKRNPVSTR